MTTYFKLVRLNQIKLVFSLCRKPNLEAPLKKVIGISMIQIQNTKET